MSQRVAAKILEKLHQQYDYRITKQPAQLLFRQVVFLGVIILISVIVFITAYQAQSITFIIKTQIEQLLYDYPEYKEHIVIDGRDVYLRGKTELDTELDDLIKQMRQIPLLRDVTNLLEIESKPTPYLLLYGTIDSLSISGELSGDALESVVEAVDKSFPTAKLRDEMLIDDRLGKPLWLHGFAQALQQLHRLDYFELHAWRRQLQLTGVAKDTNEARHIGYSFPASMRRQISLDNRIRQRSTTAQAQIELTVDWSGIRLKGTLPNIADISRLTQSAHRIFGRDKIDIDLKLVAHSQALWLNDLVELLPHLGIIRSLRLQNDGPHLSLWGSVDSPYQLGILVNQRDRLASPDLFNFNINVEPATQSATLALFVDQDNIYLGGLVPTLVIKNQIETNIARLLDRPYVFSEIKVKPGIADSYWIQIWQRLLLTMPQTGITGLSIDDKHILITGSAKRPDHIKQAVRKLLPSTQLHNWVSVIP